MTHANPMVTDMMMQISQKLFNAAQAGDADLCLATMRKAQEMLDLYIRALGEGEDSGVTS